MCVGKTGHRFVIYARTKYICMYIYIQLDEVVRCSFIGTCHKWNSLDLKQQKNYLRGLISNLNNMWELLLKIKLYSWFMIIVEKLVNVVISNTPNMIQYCSESGNKFCLTITWASLPPYITIFYFPRVLDTKSHIGSEW